jgi:predicted SAM-dependent methyltransferase
MKIYRQLRYLWSLGLVNLFVRIYYKLYKKNFVNFIDFEMFRSKNGLEIGGPSKFFTGNGIIPIYDMANNIDNVNYAAITKWEGLISKGKTFKFSKKKLPGNQYIFEASNLFGMQNEYYDFILSCHSLEHSANVFKTLKEWLRVLKHEGCLVIILPDKKYTFDHKRPFTTIEHLIEDELMCVDENDQTHFSEIRSLHDLSRDVEQRNSDEFEKWLNNNHENRGCHHHIFSDELMFKVANHLGLHIIFIDTAPPHNLIYILKKP